MLSRATCTSDGMMRTLSKNSSSGRCTSRWLRYVGAEHSALPRMLSERRCGSFCSVCVQAKLASSLSPAQIEGN